MKKRGNRPRRSASSIAQRVSHHEIFWEKRWYKTDLDKRLRYHPLVGRIVMLNYYHNQGSESLHANVEAPPKPGPQLELGALAVLRELDRDTSHVDAINHLVDYFDSLKADDAFVGRRIADNLSRQLLYIEPGIMEAQAMIQRRAA